MKKIIFLIFLIPIKLSAQYSGTASVTQGIGSINNPNLYTCIGGRIPAAGEIVAADGSIWPLPAQVNFLDGSFPFASDLHNVCNGQTFVNDGSALAALDGSDIVTIDSAGELMTAFIFADNYFEMYVNGIPVGKDKVPYTQFNSSIIRFRVNKPFTIAMLLVDWEEYLGIGCENSNGFAYHMGDGGVAVVIKNSSNQIVAKTDTGWKAQTFYTAPILDLSCPTENGKYRLSGNCSTQDSNNGNAYYGLHWSKPINWMNPIFTDSLFPPASTFTNAIVGVNNKPAYTNFTNIFDDPVHDAEFIWSTNLILDNEVVVRYTIDSTTSLVENANLKKSLEVYPNPMSNEFEILLGSEVSENEITLTQIINPLGEVCFSSHQFYKKIFLPNYPNGIYILEVYTPDQKISKKLVVQKEYR